MLGEKPYKCHNCSTTFARQRDLRQYIKRHTNSEE